MWLIVMNKQFYNQKEMHLKERICKLKYTVLGYKINIYFYEYKLAIEVDELGHNDRNIDH